MASSGTGGDEKELTISEAYHEANSLYQKVKDSMLGSSDPAQITLVKKAISSNVKVRRMVGSLALFSDNEELRDISSTNMKYLLCDFFIGDLFLNLYEQKYRDRFIKEGLACIKRFLSKCEDLKLMSELDKACYKRNGKPGSIATARTEKIERHKANKKHKSDLQELLKREKLKAEKEGVKEDDDLEEDDDERRKQVLKAKLAISECLDHLRFAEDELRMIEFQRKREEEIAKNGGGGATQDGAPRPLPKKGDGSSIIHIKSAEDFMRRAGIVKAPAASNPRQGGGASLAGGMQRLNLAPASHTRKIAGTVSGKPDARTQVLSEMYVPRNMPTMDLDTMLELEMKQGKIPRPQPKPRKKERKNNNYEDEETKEEEEHSDEDDDEEHNARQKKRRDWDNYKDDHEKGAGNRLGNPRGRNFI
mmetsp:Transcript_36247/g.58654  ORF Transcript_36247/g.58654 Transcript_36247/m.58654 type:complete len:420 (+) Transcript_36247:40-1299(+)